MQPVAVVHSSYVVGTVSTDNGQNYRTGVPLHNSLLITGFNDTFKLTLVQHASPVTLSYVNKRLNVMPVMTHRATSAPYVCSY